MCTRWCAFGPHTRARHCAHIDDLDEDPGRSKRATAVVLCGVGMKSFFFFLSKWTLSVYRYSLISENERRQCTLYYFCVSLSFSHTHTQGLRVPLSSFPISEPTRRFHLSRTTVFPSDETDCSAGDISDISRNLDIYGSCFSSTVCIQPFSFSCQSPRITPPPPFPQTLSLKKFEVFGLSFCWIWRKKGTSFHFVALTNCMSSGGLREKLAFPLVHDCTSPEADSYVVYVGLHSQHHRTWGRPNAP